VSLKPPVRSRVAAPSAQLLGDELAIGVRIDALAFLPNLETATSVDVGMPVPKHGVLLDLAAGEAGVAHGSR
jgi:hypothetical protein